DPLGPAQPGLEGHTPLIILEVEAPGDFATDRPALGTIAAGMRGGRPLAADRWTQAVGTGGSSLAQGALGQSVIAEPHMVGASPPMGTGCPGPGPQIVRPALGGPQAG